MDWLSELLASVGLAPTDEQQAWIEEAVAAHIASAAEGTPHEDTPAKGAAGTEGEPPLAEETAGTADAEGLPGCNAEESGVEAALLREECSRLKDELERLSALRLNDHLTAALHAAGTVDPGAVGALLDREAIYFDEQDTLAGFDAQLPALRERHPALFAPPCTAGSKGNFMRERGASAPLPLGRAIAAHYGRQ